MSLAASAHLGDLGHAWIVVVLAELGLNTTKQRSSGNHRTLHRDPHHLQLELGFVAVVGFDCDFDFVGHKAAVNVSTDR